MKSKEHRLNPIIQTELYVDGNEIPLAFSLFSGNANEQTSLKPLEKKVLTDFGCQKFKSSTTSSTGGLILPLQRGIVTARPEGRCHKHYYWSAYKAVLLESSFLDSSACSLIYFCTASSVILPIVST